MKLAIIVAMGPAREIGLHNKLLWHLPGDLQHFKKLTMGGVLIMGRNTYQSIGRILPGRFSIILSTSLTPINQADCWVVPSKEEVFNRLEQLNRDKIFVIGGAQIYQLFLPFVVELHLSLVDYHGPADAYFPSWQPDDWEICEQIPHPGPPAWVYQRLSRVR